jgi:hemerythrin superfamily protein
MAEKTLDAITFLKAEHREVEELFTQIGETDGAEKGALVGEVCHALKIHARLEEEIAYPAFRAAGVDGVVMDDANIEHQSVKKLIADIESLSQNDHLFGARVKVLSEHVKDHVEEEEGTMFSQVSSSKADLKDIGRRLTERKRELMTKSSEALAAL